MSSAAIRANFTNMSPYYSHAEGDQFRQALRLSVRITLIRVEIFDPNIMAERLQCVLFRAMKLL
jgi:hypothetical protein